MRKVSKGLEVTVEHSKRNLNLLKNAKDGQLIGLIYPQDSQVTEKNWLDISITPTSE